MPLILNTCIQQTYLLLLWWKETPMLLPMEEHDSQITTWLWTGTSVHLQTGRTGLYQNYHVVVNWRLTLVPISCQVIERQHWKLPCGCKLEWTHMSTYKQNYWNYHVVESNIGTHFTPSDIDRTGQYCILPHGHENWGWTLCPLRSYHVVVNWSWT